MRWDENTNIRIFRTYYVNPVRLIPQIRIINGGWGPVLMIAWLGRLVVFGLHSNDARKRYK